VLLQHSLAGGVGKRGTIGPGRSGGACRPTRTPKETAAQPRGRAACELPNAFPSIGTRATYRQLRPARYPQTRAVADKKRHPARRTWATQGFPITLTRKFQRDCRRGHRHGVCDQRHRLKQAVWLGARTGVDGTLNPALTWPRCEPLAGPFSMATAACRYRMHGSYCLGMAKLQAGKTGQQFRTIVFEHVEVVVAPWTRWTGDLRAFKD
jgi:hypothetical protein